MLADKLQYQFPRWVQWLYPALYRVEQEDRKVVYLTFDDGPIPEVTPRVLDILNHFGVKATFFMVGDNVCKHPEVYDMVVRQGHSVGNHTYNHLKGTRTSARAYMNNVAKCRDRVGETSLFRPPYGKLSPIQYVRLRRMGYKICLWDVMTHDWDSDYSAERMMEIVKRYTRNGSIINMHDSLKSNDRMLQVLPMMIEWLLNNGYTIERLES